MAQPTVFTFLASPTTLPQCAYTRLDGPDRRRLQHRLRFPVIQHAWHVSLVANVPRQVFEVPDCFLRLLLGLSRQLTGQQGAAGLPNWTRKGHLWKRIQPDSTRPDPPTQPSSPSYQATLGPLRLRNKKIKGTQ